MEKVNIYAFADEASPQITQQIAAMKRNQLSGLEIRNVDGINVSDITLDKAKEVKGKIYDSGLTIWSVGSPLGKIDINEDFKHHLEKFKYTLEIAHALEAENMRIFSFYIPKCDNPNQYRDEVINRLGLFAEAAQGSGICLCHENEKGIYGDIPERCLEIHRALPSIKGIFDPANFVQCGIDTLEAWKKLREHIRYMHIKDAKEDGTIVLAGHGIGNIRSIAKEYMEQGGRDFTMEPHLTVFEGLKGLEREGEETKMLFQFSDGNTAFDTACHSFKTLLTED